MKRLLLFIAVAFSSLNALRADVLYQSAFEPGFTDHWRMISRDGPEAELSTEAMTLPDGREVSALVIDDSRQRGVESYLTVRRLFEPQEGRAVRMSFIACFRSHGVGSNIRWDWRVRMPGKGDTIFLRLRRDEPWTGISYPVGSPRDFQRSDLRQWEADRWFRITVEVHPAHQSYSWKAEALDGGASAEVAEVPFLPGSSRSVEAVAFTTISRGGVLCLAEVTVETID